MRHRLPESKRMRMRQDVLASGSYISANDRRLHFGLGEATDAGTAEIHWPSGAKEMVKLPPRTVFIPLQRAWGLPARSAAEAGARAMLPNRRSRANTFNSWGL